MQKTVSCPFNYEQLLVQAVKKGKFSVTTPCDFPPKPKIKKSRVDCKSFIDIAHKSDLMAFHQSQNIIYLCFSVSVLPKQLQPLGNLPYKFDMHAERKNELGSTELKKQHEESKLTFFAFNKRTQKLFKKHEMNTTKGQVTAIQFSYGTGEKQFQLELYILVGTKSGQLKIISNDKDKSFYIQSQQLSYYRVQQISKSPWTDVCTVLLQNSTVLFVNFVKKVVILQAINNSILFDTPISTKIHYSHEYFMTTSKIGTICLWRVGEDFQQARNKLKKITYIKPNFQISSLSKYGLIWSDFIGSFFGMLVQNQKRTRKILKIVAISFNLIKQAQHFEVLSSIQVTKYEGQRIPYVQCYPEKRLIFMCIRSKKLSRIQIYHFNQFYQTNEITTVEMNCQPIKQFRVNSTFEYLVIRQGNIFKITQEKALFKQLVQKRVQINDLEVEAMFYENDTNCDSNF